jgi:hypothetical protein
MRTRQSIQIEITHLNMEISPLIRKRSVLKRELNEVESRNWIAANGVTIDQVEPEPPFGTCGTIFDAPARTGKRFLTWNGRVYFTADIAAGRMPRENGLLEHVPQTTGARDA